MSLIRPKRLPHKKYQKGFFTVHSGSSLSGTQPYYGEFGLQALEGTRLEDKQLDNARTAIRRKIKNEKGSKIFLRCFPDMPVTSKGSEARMGKGKGAVDYYAKWISEGSMIFEVKGVRMEIAKEAMRCAAAVLPIKSRFVEAPPDHQAVPPRVLPFFIKKRLNDLAKTEKLQTIEKVVEK